MEHFGLIIGMGLLGIVSITAWLLATKANAGVREFREEHHENFVGRNKS